MLVVTVELRNGITGKRKTLAVMRICNDCTGTAQRGNYPGDSFSRSTGRIMRSGRVTD